MPFDDDVIDLTHITQAQRDAAFDSMDTDPCADCWSQYTCRRPAYPCKKHRIWMDEVYQKAVFK